MPVGAAATDSSASMNNRDAQVISVVLGVYAFPEPSRNNDNVWDSDTMILAWAPWFNSAALEQESIVTQYAVYGWLPGGILLGATETWAW